jgi:hypothetical protein
MTALLRRVNADGAINVEIREFGMSVKELTALGEWLVEEGCPVEEMESTGVHWKPVWHIQTALVGVEVTVGSTRL